VRLRPLTEAECYARCYGGVRTEQVSVLRPAQAHTERERVPTLRLRELARDGERRPEAA
jgi:hypothetical protein